MYPKAPTPRYQMHLPRTGSCENNSLDVGDPRPPQRSRSYDPDFRAPSAKVMCNFDITFSLPDVSLVCLHFLLFPKDKQKRKFKRNLREKYLISVSFLPLYLLSQLFRPSLFFSWIQSLFFQRSLLVSRGSCLGNLRCQNLKKLQTNKNPWWRC